jgi:hypothetical protein
MQITAGLNPWLPVLGAERGESWHFYDYPRWGYFTMAGARIAFHDHEILGNDDRASLWTYRWLDAAGLAELSLPYAGGGAAWGDVYEGWRQRTFAHAWATANERYEVVHCGTLEPPLNDDAAWALAFAAARGIRVP